MSAFILFLITGPLLILAIYRYLPPETGNARLWFAVAAGTLIATGINNVLLLLFGKLETSESLLAKSQGAREDGKPVLAHGRLNPLAPLLSAPISGTPCAAYFYRMYKIVHRTKGGYEEVPVYWGYASIPFVVESLPRSVPVHAATEFQVPRTPLTGDEAIARAREFIRLTPAADKTPRPFFAGDPVRQWMTDVSVADDGRASHHWKSDNDDPASLTLEESLLLSDVEVSIYGLWSAQRNAVVGTGTRRALLALGPPSRIVGLVPQSHTANWVGTVVSIVLGAGVVWFAIAVWPQL
jgi:hypothetical protein